MTPHEQVEQCLETIRPALAMHGGNVELLEVKDGIVRVKLQGACKGCPMSQITLKMGIEAEIMSNVPDVVRVIAVAEDDSEACCDDGEGDCCSTPKTPPANEDEWFRELMGGRTV